MRVGFPWISLDFSCESRLFNRLRGLNRENFFLRPSPWRCEAPGRERAVEAMRKRRIVHGPKLNQASDFPQEIVVRAVPFRPPQSKSSSRQARRRTNPEPITEERLRLISLLPSPSRHDSDLRPFRPSSSPHEAGSVARKTARWSVES